MSDATGTELAILEAAVGTPEYWRNEGQQDRYRELLAERDGVPQGHAGDPDAWRGSVEAGKQLVPAEVAAEWGDGFVAALHRVQDMALVLTQAIGDRSATEGILAAIDRLPAPVRAALIAEAGRPEPGYVRPPTADMVAAFKEHPAGPALMKLWGRDATKRVGIYYHRLGGVMNTLSEADQATFVSWLQGLGAHGSMCCIFALAQA